MMFMRTKRVGSAESVNRIGPKRSDHPTCGDHCPACGVRFAAGDFTTLVPLGPGDDEDERVKCRAGGYFNAIALELHWSCVTGEP